MSLKSDEEPEKEDPQEVENFIRTLLTTLDVFKSESALLAIKEEAPDETAALEPAAGAGEAGDIKEIFTAGGQEEVPLKSTKSTLAAKSAIVGRKASTESKKQLYFAPTQSEITAGQAVKGEFVRPSDDQVVVEKFIRDMIDTIDFDKEEPRVEKSVATLKRRSKADVKTDKEDRDSTHRFIRGILENIDVYKEVMKKRMKERLLLEQEFGEGYAGFYDDYAEYLAERSEEEEEAFEIPRKEEIRRESLKSTCYKCVCMPNGDIYEGEYIQGKRHGRGLYCFKNGARYDGYWKKGLKHGKGQFLYPDGSRYIGNWKRDLKHGQGVYYYINGDIYDGGWYKGVRHGLGTYTYKSSNVTHYGTWKYGRMDGPGVLNYPYYKYHGNFERNLPKGPGCFVFDGKYMQHGFYVHERDPTVLPEVDLQMEYAQTEGMRGSFEQYQDAVGLVPVWKARQLTKYSADLLPPEPVPLLIKESQESMVDIIEYLQQQYAGGRPTLGRQGIGRPCW